MAQEYVSIKPAFSVKMTWHQNIQDMVSFLESHISGNEIFIVKKKKGGGVITLTHEEYVRLLMEIKY